MKDPICNMEVENKDISADCNGEVFYFCSEGCRDRFLKERSCKLPRRSYDVIIIGGGPAGLTAAVYSATLKMDALLVTKDLGGQAIDSTKIINYMGYDFITGPELVDKFQHQLIHSRYIDHLVSEVEQISRSESGFSVTVSGPDVYSSRCLIVATGMTRRKLLVKGEEEFQRKGIFYGNIQDLSFVHDEDAAVIGGGNSAIQIVENLRTVAANIHLITDVLIADPGTAERIRSIENLQIHEGYKVTEFTGRENLSGITIRQMGGAKTKQIPVKGAFIAIGLHPNSSLVSHLVDMNERGEIIIGPDCSTSCPGLFAAGDVTNAYGKRIIIACGEGAKAIMASRQYMLDLRKKANAVALKGGK